MTKSLLKIKKSYYLKKNKIKAYVQQEAWQNVGGQISTHSAVGYLGASVSGRRKSINQVTYTKLLLTLLCFRLPA